MVRGSSSLTNTQEKAVAVHSNHQRPQRVVVQETTGFHIIDTDKVGGRRASHLQRALNRITLQDLPEPSASLSKPGKGRAAADGGMV